MTPTEQIYADLAARRAANFHAGPLGLPEGAQAAVIPQAMQDSWAAYWDNYRPNSVDMTGAGGALVRIGPDAAVYTFILLLSEPMARKRTVGRLILPCGSCKQLTLPRRLLCWRKGQQFGLPPRSA